VKGSVQSDSVKTNPDSAALARSITWKGSKQLFFISLLLADRDLIDDCYRAYAYFRWSDDVIDLELPPGPERRAFADRQKDLIRRLYAGERPAHLSPEESMLADLILHDRGPDSGLRSFIDQFMWVLAFDACRAGLLVHQKDLNEYTDRLAVAVMDGIQYFVGNRHPYPKPPDRTQAVTGAHATHMLRDLRQDIAGGIINIPRESIAALGLDSANPDGESFRAWVRERVGEARRNLREGRRYIDSLTVLRCKLAGIWYCARFERVLNTMERDGFRLRKEYHDRREVAAWIEMAWLGIKTILHHVFSGESFASRRNDSKKPEPSNLSADTQ
jgi:phytoene/squalene synthetase